MPARLSDARAGVQACSITVDDRAIRAYPGETVAAAMLAAGIGSFGSDRAGAATGPYCNMGTCYQCVVTIKPDDRGWVRACLEPVRPDLCIHTRRA